MGGECSMYGERRGACRILVGKTEGKRPLGRPRRRLENKIKMDLQEVGCGDMGWIDLAHDKNRYKAFVNSVMDPRGPKRARNFLTNLHGLSN